MRSFIKLWLILLFLVGCARGQGNFPIRGDIIYFIDAAGDTAFVMDVANNEIGIGTLSPVSRFHISQEGLYIQQRGLKITTDNSGHSSSDGLSIYMDVANNTQFKNNEGGYFNFDGYLKRRDVMNWDNIALYPPADSGAVLDTLDNVIEVLSFYHNTDSVNAYGTFQLNPWESQVDSFHLYFHVPESFIANDSVSFALLYRVIAEGVQYNQAFTVLDTSHYKLGASATLKDFVHLSFLSGIVGEAANNLVDIRLQRINSFVNNAPSKVSIRRLRVFKQ